MGALFRQSLRKFSRLDHTVGKDHRKGHSSLFRIALNLQMKRGPLLRTRQPWQHLGTFKKALVMKTMNMMYQQYNDSLQMLPIIPRQASRQGWTQVPASWKMKNLKKRVADSPTILCSCPASVPGPRPLGPSHLKTHLTRPFVNRLQQKNRTPPCPRRILQAQLL